MAIVEASDLMACADLPGHPEVAEAVARYRLSDWRGLRLGERVKVRWIRFSRREGDPDSDVVHIDCGPSPKIEHIDRGADDGYDRETWAHKVEVYVSPTGRSVRVYVDGVEFKRCG